MKTHLKKLILNLSIPLLCLGIFSTANAQKNQHEDLCEKMAVVGVPGYALHRANGKPKSFFLEQFSRQNLTPTERKYFDFALNFAYAPENKIKTTDYEEAKALGDKFKPLCMNNRTLAR